MAEPERRRRRPAISCALCRRRKIRCNRETPCSNCVRSKSEPCVYENPPPPALRQPINRDRATIPTHSQSSPGNHAIIPLEGSSFTGSHASVSIGAGSTIASSPTNPSSIGDFESMRRRIQELERQLNSHEDSSKQPDLVPAIFSMDTAKSGIAGTFHIQRDGQQANNGLWTSRNVMHKTRLFGQSHWFNGVTLFQDMFELLEPFVHDQASKPTAGIKKCKSIAKAIKLGRSPQWPLPPTTELPSKDIADALVGCYLRASESIYRVLHVPSFRRDYENLWLSTTDRDMAFVIQVKLVLAIGAVTYDKTFSLRELALRWIYEAQTWLAAPVYKSRLVLQIMQAHVLHLLAREAVGVGEDLVWASSGELLRRAIFMGLHVDPSRLPPRSTLASEMRRRIWNTIIEINVMSSMSAGGAPFLSLDDFNTEPPGNLDDDRLLSEDPILKPENEFTQVSIAIALRKTLPIRLEIAKFLNCLNATASYSETLRLDAELRSVYKDVSKLLKGFGSMGEEDNSQPPYTIQVVDFIIRRCILSLHAPFFGPSLHETSYAFSRKILLDTSLKLWAAVYPSSLVAYPQPGREKPEETLLSRLTCSSCLFYRIVSMQCFFFISAELNSQLQEDEGFGTVSVRPDLLGMVNEVKDWCWQSIEAGETNMKGYLFSSMVSVQLNALRQGATREELASAMLKAVEETVEKCLAKFEAVKGSMHKEISEVIVDGDTPVGFMEDWDLMMGDSDFNIGDWDPNGWAMNDVNMNEFSIW